jgi:hypothetical protein
MNHSFHAPPKYAAACRTAVEQMNTRPYPASAHASRRARVFTFFKVGCRSGTLCHNHFARLQSA